MIRVNNISPGEGQYGQRESRLSLRTNRVTNSSTLVRSSLDLVWSIAVWRATIRYRRHMSPQRIQGAVLIFQDL
jgi:hypothetical protein